MENKIHGTHLDYENAITMGEEPEKSENSGDGPFPEDDTKKENGDKCEILFSPPLYLQRRIFINQKLMQYKDLLSLRSVCDVGCGNGEFISFIRNQGFEVICGIDKCEQSIETATRYCSPLIYHFIKPLEPNLDVYLYHSDVIQCAKEIDQSNINNQKDANNKQISIEKSLNRGSICIDQNPIKHMIDAIVSCEVIEHVEFKNVKYFEIFIFEIMKPKIVIITTPNSDFNTWFGFEKGQMRHDDHKFEWSREEFKRWANHVEYTYSNYKLLEPLTGVGRGKDQSLDHGYATQIAIFIHCNYLNLNDSSNVQFKNNSMETLSNFSIDFLNLFQKKEYPRPIVDKRSIERILIDNFISTHNQFLHYISRKNLFKFDHQHNMNNDDENDDENDDDDDDDNENDHEFSSWHSLESLLTQLNNQTLETIYKTFGKEKPLIDIVVELIEKEGAEEIELSSDKTKFRLIESNEDDDDNDDYDDFNNYNNEDNKNDDDNNNSSNGEIYSEKEGFEYGSNVFNNNNNDNDDNNNNDDDDDDNAWSIT